MLRAFSSSVVRPDIRQRFHVDSLSQQRQFCTTMMSYAVLAFVFATLVRQMTQDTAGYVAYRLLCAIVMGALVFLLSRAHRPAQFGVIGTAFMLVLECGMWLNAINAHDPLCWILPSAVMIPVVAAPLWLTPLHFIVGTASFYGIGFALVNTLDLRHDAAIFCFFWGIVGVSACVLFEAGFYRFRLHHFQLKRRLDDLVKAQQAASVDAMPSSTPCSWAGIELKSHFQPLFSLSHQKAVGFEVLLRGYGADGTPISPPHIFGADPKADLTALDRLTQRLHLSNAHDALPDGAWLFLNVLPQTFILPGHPEFLENLVIHAGLATANIVIEVLESQDGDIIALSEAAARYRERGFQIAIDDFGAGHSNLDRLLRIQPDIVKLDGGLIRARCRSTKQPLLPYLVSLLHNVGMLVVVEGVETTADLILAVESNVDLVQGYLLGQPDTAANITVSDSAERVEQAFQQVGDMHGAQRRTYETQLQPYLSAMRRSVEQLRADGHPFPGFHALPMLELPLCYGCYLLDASGRPVLDPAFPGNRPPPAPRFPPMASNWDARWDNKPFFVAALATIGHPVFSQPYHSLTSGRACVALACAIPHQDQLLVLVTKLDWTSPSLAWPVATPL
ncbi:EAL domain-containing protein [Robbsia andropogonis]|uniref:EAL domain-containing protein n=1 Tax=Robbsia andropogonis TaxID=28092 RepID=UPI0004B3018E|nr:EAL domain-containing protein [Robbsia andropogonis]MCP1118074.1 EAL domain-containing protein [Robbsia andropogonis]MCP1127645.1 EAL domain-containing protein [Robbsia andropogonis]